MFRKHQPTWPWNKPPRKSRKKKVIGLGLVSAAVIVASNAFVKNKEQPK